MLSARRLLRTAATLILLLMVARPANADVLVSAAASLTDVLTVIAQKFEAATGEKVLLNFAASNTLVRQISAGARVDVFVSADEIQMDRLGAAVAAGTRIDLLSNQLAIAMAVGAAPLASVSDLLEPRIRRIAIGDPDAVPAGVYARQYLETLGLWTRLQPKFVPSGSVRLALAAVETGAAEAAIVYATDVPTAANATTVFVVPIEAGPMIRYPAALLSRASNPAGGRRFLQYLQGTEARAAFLAAGFRMASGTAGRP